MEQENKELLLQDLCARLPYGVMIHLDDFPDAILMGINNGVAILDDATHDPIHNAPWNIEYIKPYLFPLSSMTDEQYKIYYELEHSGNMEHLSLPLLEWLNKNHFDYRDLIPKGLAIDATELNIY